MTKEISLPEIRTRIDSLDEQIQDLIRQRAECALEVAQSKRAEAEKNGGHATDFYRPEREAEVLRMVQERNNGPLDDEAVAHLFRELMSACLALQEPMKIAYLGPEGTFTQAAALKHFGQSINTVSHSAIDEVFRDVEAGNSHYGVVPVENSTEGVVSHTLDMFMQSSLQISGEVELRIHHNLLSSENALTNITKIYSHQQSLAQCREWLDANLPNAERVSVSSNAGAAKRAANEKGSAAIASDTAASIYNLNVIAANIEDEPDNTTRFLIIGRNEVGRSGVDKTTLLVSIVNKHAALHELLTPFANNDVSLTRIESRPSRQGMWDYVFFIDIDGHREDPMIAKALQDLTDKAAMLKVLGSYPKAVL